MPQGAQSFLIFIIQPLVTPNLEEGWVQLMAEKLCPFSVRWAGDSEMGLNL